MRVQRVGNLTGCPVEVVQALLPDPRAEILTIERLELDPDDIAFFVGGATSSRTADQDRELIEDVVDLIAKSGCDGVILSEKIQPGLLHVAVFAAEALDLTVFYIEQDDRRGVRMRCFSTPEQKRPARMFS